jgi:ParB-like chromosome segregation protein Spo0J
MQSKITKSPKQASPPPTMMARISSIVVGPRIDKLDRAKVTRYRQALRRGDMFPPIAVIKHRRGCYEIFDGYHRFHAHRLEGRKTIAVWLAVS